MTAAKTALLVACPKKLWSTIVGLLRIEPNAAMPIYIYGYIYIHNNIVYISTLDAASLHNTISSFKV